MALLNIFGFDTGDSSDFNSSGGTFSFVTSPVHSTAGGYALRCNPTTTATGWLSYRKPSSTTGEVSTSFASATLRTRFYFRYATKPTTASEQLWSTLVSGKSPVQAALRIDLDGKLSFWSAPTTQLGSTGATVLAANTWYRIDVKLVSAAWEIRLNGTVELSGADVKNWTTTDVVFGKHTNRNGNTVDFFYDDVAIDDAAYPADGQCALLVSNAAGNYQTWSRGGADSGANWSQADEVPPNGATDYLLSTLVSGNAEIEAMTTVASIGTVNGVKGHAVSAQDAASPAHRTRLRSGSTDTDTSADGSGAASYAARCTGSVLVTDPATSAAWTQAGIDGIQYGLINRSTTARTRMTFAGVVVDYVPAPLGSLLLRLQQERLFVGAAA